MVDDAFWMVVEMGKVGSLLLWGFGVRVKPGKLSIILISLIWILAESLVRYELWFLFKKFLFGCMVDAHLEFVQV